MILFVAIIASCSDGIVSDYYRVQVSGSGRVDIKKLDSYENDSIAIASHDEYTKWWIERLGERISDAEGRRKGASPEERRAIDREIDASVSLLGSTFSLLKMSYRGNYNEQELLDIIQENGLFSKKAREYAEENDVRFEILR